MSRQRWMHPTKTTFSVIMTKSRGTRWRILSFKGWLQRLDLPIKSKALYRTRNLRDRRILIAHLNLRTRFSSTPNKTSWQRRATFSKWSLQTSRIQGILKPITTASKLKLWWMTLRGSSAGRTQHFWNRRITTKEWRHLAPTDRWL